MIALITPELNNLILDLYARACVHTEVAFEGFLILPASYHISVQFSDPSVLPEIQRVELHIQTKSVHVIESANRMVTSLL